MAPIMSPDNQFFHRFNDFPPNHQNVESARSELQVTNDYPIFNSPSQLQSGQQLMNIPATIPNLFTSNYNFPTSMSTLQAPDGWSAPPMISQHFQTLDHNQYLSNHNYCYRDYSTTGLENNQDQGVLGGVDFSNVPRSSPALYDTSMLNNNSISSKAYDPAFGHLDSPGEHPGPNSSTRLFPSFPAYDSHDSSRAFARLSISRSPKLESHVGTEYVPSNQPDLFQAPSTPSSDGGGEISREMTVVDTEDRSGGAEEPYAKLIYRALMSDPNHSMVLQEIYRWFRENTSKGSSDSKGWMNSIRHNLSMNAAFKKTERKLPGDETKKSTEWVLEDFAVKDGVQSTTRYRIKGSGTKKLFKAESPAPARQSSGRKGGLSTSKGKSRQRVKVKVERQDRYHSFRQSDTGGVPHHQHQSGSQLNQRYPLSPSPPPNPESISSPHPYVFHSLGPNDAFYEDFCSLENVHGVVEEQPVFQNGLHQEPDTLSPDHYPRF